MREVRKGTLASWALVASACLLLSGCGSAGEDADGTTTASITKAHFIARASTACGRIHRAAQAEFLVFLRNGGSEPQDPGALAAYQAKLGRKFVIGVKRQELAEFRALGLPSDDGGGAKAVIASFEEGIRKAEQDPARAAQNSTESLGKAEGLANEYGLTGC
jgi:hypothetical protein